MKYQALSILKPAVNLIVNGDKTSEIRSWLPAEMPLKNILLVQNDRYLTSEEDEEDGICMAIVDFIEFSPWTEQKASKTSPLLTLGRTWKPGYFEWRIENVRKISNPAICKAKKGIYVVDVESNLF
ncbi:hypothetical protein AAGR22_17060 [Erwinia sp. HDF1-3R]|uniref:hypothetical protein n=1 Tax=Erwinia sp. HDF1-3R TaxID=3141543 RepID=UPI0031F5358D